MGKRLICILTIFLALSSVSFADAIGSGARSIALGNSNSTGILNETACIFSNPAGLARIQISEITSMYGQIKEDITYTLLGVAVPTKFGTFGIGYSAERTPEMASTGLDGLGKIVQLSTYSYSSGVYSLSYANSINKIDYGVTLKESVKSFGGITDGQGQGLNADIGVVINANSRIKMGLTAQNVITGSAGAIRWQTGVSEEQPYTLKAGIGYTGIKVNVLAALESTKDRPSELKAGIEYKLSENLALRCGVEQKNASTSEQYYNYSAGAGIKIFGAKVDYAYYHDSLIDYNSRHFVSISIELSKLGRGM